MKPKSFEALAEEVIRPGLCVRCGACAGVCPAGCIAFTDIEGECLPEKVGRCTSCGQCIRICPGRDVDFPKLDNAGGSHDDYLGSYRGIWVGHATDSRLRRTGASGGVATAIMLHLLEERLVSKVLCLGFDAERPYLTEAKLTDNPREVMAAAQSKYAINPMLRKLREAKDESVAVVCLPCQAHALRKLNSPKIEYIVSLYCGNQLPFRATEDLLRRCRVEKRDVARISYREGAWPGYFTVKAKDGRVARLHKFMINYLTPLYALRRCLLCIDATGELADISLGDGWKKQDKGAGRNAIIARSKKGHALIQSMADKGIISVSEVSCSEARRMHNFLFSFKKEQNYRRNQVRRPNADYHLPEKPGRRLGLIMMSAALWLGHLRATRAAVRLVPSKVLEWAFVRLRMQWKK